VRARPTPRSKPHGLRRYWLYRPGRLDWNASAIQLVASLLGLELPALVSTYLLIPEALRAVREARPERRDERRFRGPAGTTIISRRRSGLRCRRRVRATARGSPRAMAPAAQP